MRIVDVEQGTAEWLAARCGLPSASDFGSVITPAGKASASADAYAAELIDEIARPMAERDEEEQGAQFRGNRHTERGHREEPKARTWLRLVTGLDVRTAGFVMNDAGTLGCSPDALIYADGTPIEGAEIKAPEGKKHVLWMLQDKLPDEHKQQVHGSMVVTGLRAWHFVSYCPGYKPFRLRVEWDDYTDKAAKELAAFADRLAEAKTRFIDYLPQQKAA